MRSRRIVVEILAVAFLVAGCLACMLLVRSDQYTRRAGLIIFRK